MIEKSSIRETDKTLEQMTHVPLPARKVEPLSLDHFDGALQAKLKRLLEVRSHNIEANDLHGLIDQLADLGLKHFDPVVKAERALLRSERKSQKSETSQDEFVTKFISIAPAQMAATVDAPRPATFKVNQRKTRYVHAATNHRLFLRDRGRCTNCGGSMRIQKDHRNSFAIGGSNEIENLQLLCRSCNQRHAIETYGIEKMSRFLKEPCLEYRPTFRWARVSTRNPPITPRERSRS
ncbi:MAG: HNH endonuclease signature motif containing protein [Bdellovibrionota bacterium]